MEHWASGSVDMLNWAVEFCSTGEVMDAIFIKPCPASWGGDDGVGVGGGGVSERAGDDDGLIGSSVGDGVLVEV